MAEACEGRSVVVPWEEKDVRLDPTSMLTIMDRARMYLPAQEEEVVIRVTAPLEVVEDVIRRASLTSRLWFET